VRRLRHLGLLLRDLVQLSSAAGALWLVPVLVILLLTAALAVAAHTAAPFVVYTFF
jgi:hypothetical protein